MMLEQNTNKISWGNLRSSWSGEAVTCLLELYLNTLPFIHETRVLRIVGRLAGVTNQNAVTTVRSIKWLKLRKRAFEHLAFFRKRASEQDCSTFASTSKICARAFEQRLNFASISKNKRDHLLPLQCWLDLWLTSDELQDHIRLLFRLSGVFG